jgi:sec-independent protein translocase protein TatA
MITFFAMLNGWEIVLILAVVLVLFGAKRLPELARGLGQGIREFKKSTREIQDEIESAVDIETPPSRPAPPRKLASEIPPSSSTDADRSSSEPKA